MARARPEHTRGIPKVRLHGDNSQTQTFGDFAVAAPQRDIMEYVELPAGEGEARSALTWRIEQAIDFQLGCRVSGTRADHTQAITSEFGHPEAGLPLCVRCHEKAHTCIDVITDREFCGDLFGARFQVTQLLGEEFRFIPRSPVQQPSHLGLHQDWCNREKSDPLPQDLRVEVMSDDSRGCVVRDCQGATRQPALPAETTLGCDRDASKIRAVVPSGHRDRDGRLLVEAPKDQRESSLLAQLTSGCLKKSVVIRAHQTGRHPTPSFGRSRRAVRRRKCGLRYGTCIKE